MDGCFYVRGLEQLVFVGVRRGSRAREGRSSLLTMLLRCRSTVLSLMKSWVAGAYRRGRRKDRLLQEQGYLVLRFLAEDVARDLDGVLDALLRAIGHRRRVDS